MEGRVHNEYDAIETPVGHIPKYEDLKDLFHKVLSKDFTKEQYEAQFSIRITPLLEKLDRIEKIFKEEDNIPEAFYHHLTQQRHRLNAAKDKFGKEIISPFEFE